MSLLGLAGGTAATVANWLSPVLIGVTVVLLCRDCEGAAASIPLAETVTGIGGAFTWRLEDPGTE